MRLETLTWQTLIVDLHVIEVFTGLMIGQRLVHDYRLADGHDTRVATGALVIDGELTIKGAIGDGERARVCARIAHRRVARIVAVHCAQDLDAVCRAALHFDLCCLGHQTYALVEHGRTHVHN